MATARASSEQKQILLSYSVEDEEFKEKLVKDLQAENIEVATSDTIPANPMESLQRWSERKCKSTAAVLIIMSKEYQTDPECVEAANAATRLATPRFFSKEKNFDENEWMKQLRGDSIIYDLSTPNKYKNNLKRLINSLNKLLSMQGITF